MATGGGNQAQMSYSWTMGDGTLLSGASVQHGYGVSGSFTATVTASDGTQTASASTMVTVKGPVVGFPGDTLDSDGDGFSDRIETTFGSDPFNAASTPTGCLLALSASQR